MSRPDERMKGNRFLVQSDRLVRAHILCFMS